MTGPNLPINTKIIRDWAIGRPVNVHELAASMRGVADEYARVYLDRPQVITISTARDRREFEIDYLYALRHVYGAQQWHPTLGQAVACSTYGTHRPVPLRFVWHHVLPEACGGTRDETNMASVCDGCHYSVHHLLWQLKISAGVVSPAWKKTGTKQQRALALQGYQLAATLGTVDKIPNEG